MTSPDASAHDLLGGRRAPPRRPRGDVTFDVDDGRFTAVTPGHRARRRATGCPAWCCPASPTRTATPSTARCAGAPTTAAARSGPGGSAMYAVAARLDPDSYRALARAAYAEMALAGVTAVGEFHYLHHGPGGVPYADPNAMRDALRAAAADAGHPPHPARHLLPRGRLRRPPARGRRSCASATATCDAWADGRGSRRRPDGVAVHSVRAVPRDGARRRRRRPPTGRPLHVHLSEQPAENAACLRAPRADPDRAARRRGRARPGHHRRARHPPDRRRHRAARRLRHRACACARPPSATSPTASARPGRCTTPGAPLSLGSDQHAVIDLLEEARALEMHERLATGERGRFTPGRAARRADRPRARWAGPTPGGSRSARRADLVAVRLDTVRTAGADPAQVAARRDRRRRRHRGGRRRRRRRGRRAPARRRRRAAASAIEPSGDAHRSAVDAHVRTRA